MFEIEQKILLCLGLFALMGLVPALLDLGELKNGKKLSEILRFAIFPFILFGVFLFINLHYVIIYVLTRVALALIHNIPDIFPGVVQGPSQIMVIYYIVLFVTFAIDLKIINRRVNMSNKKLYKILGVCALAFLILINIPTYFDENAVNRLYLTIIAVMIKRTGYYFNGHSYDEDKSNKIGKWFDKNHKNESKQEIVFSDDSIQEDTFVDEPTQDYDDQDDNPIIQ